MEAKEVALDWFDKWEKGDFLNLPIAENPSLLLVCNEGVVPKRGLKRWNATAVGVLHQ